MQTVSNLLAFSEVVEKQNFSSAQSSEGIGSGIKCANMRLSEYRFFSKRSRALIIINLSYDKW